MVTFSNTVEVIYSRDVVRTVPLHLCRLPSRGVSFSEGDDASERSMSIEGHLHGEDGSPFFNLEKNISSEDFFSFAKLDSEWFDLGNEKTSGAAFMHVQTRTLLRVPASGNKPVALAA